MSENETETGTAVTGEATVSGEATFDPAPQPLAAEPPKAADTPKAPEAPALTEQEQAVSDAHTQTNEEELTWAGKIEARLAALEDHAGIGQDTKEEQS